MLVEPQRRSVPLAAAVHSACPFSPTTTTAFPVPSPRPRSAPLRRGSARHVIQARLSVRLGEEHDASLSPCLADD